MSRRDDVVLASAADERYAVPAALALLSAACTLPEPPPCLLLGAGVLPATAALLESAFARRGVALEIRDARPLLPPVDELPPGLPPAGYLRLVLPREARPLAARTLYLDADTLTTGRLAETLATDLGGAAFGAVVDAAIPGASHRNGIPGWRELGIAADAPVFNSGVLLIDNAAWVDGGLGERALAHMRAAPAASTTFDQGPLNAVAAGRWAPLGSWANIQVRNRFEIALAGRAVAKGGVLPQLEPGTLHFTGASKPWHPAYPPNRARAAYLAAWSALLPGQAAPRPQGALGWALRRALGRMPERDAAQAGGPVR